MRQKYHQGKYTIKNPQKYSGKERTLEVVGSSLS